MNHGLHQAALTVQQMDVIKIANTIKQSNVSLLILKAKAKVSFQDEKVFEPFS